MGIEDKKSDPYEEIIFDVDIEYSRNKIAATEDTPFFDKEILGVFIQDTKEHLENIENHLMLLENQSDAPDQNIIERIFRAAHSIKGGAGFMQFRKISTLALAMEELLRKMRSGEIRPEYHCTEALLKGCGLLRKMLDNPENSEEMNINTVHDILAKLSDNAENGQYPGKEQNLPGAKALAFCDDACFNREIVNVFIVESKKDLENIEQDFFTLESQATEPDQELADKIFRAIHSIKGSAGMLELTKISKLAHVMETLLQKIRLKEIYPESEYIGALLAGSALLKEMIENVSNSEEICIKDVHSQLSNLLGREEKGVGSGQWAEGSAQKAEGSEGSEGSGYRILVVEDTMFFLRLIKKYLESENYEVETAQNGLKALEVMDRADFDLIVSDIEMPEMDGLMFLKQARARKRFKNVPAIALTTLDSPEDIDRMKRAGFNAHEKKIDSKRLLTKVAQLLQVRSEK